MINIYTTGFNIQQEGNVCIREYWGAFVQQFLTWKAISITYSECVPVASASQHAIRTRRIVTCGLILVIFQQNLYTLDKFSKNIQIPNFIKIHQVGAELFHADRQTDGRYDEANSRFSQFCEKCLKILRSAHGVNCVFRLCLRLTGFITKMDSVHCAVRRGSLNKTACVSPLRD